MKLLVIKSSSMGDVVHALPVAQDIAEHFPGARIDWVVEESFRDIPVLSPRVNSIVVTAFRRWQKHLLEGRTWAEIAAVRLQVREGAYDLVIDLQGLIRTGIVAHWAGAPAAGFSFQTVREKPAALAYSPQLRFSIPETVGAVNRYRALAGAALGYKPEGRPRFGLRTASESTFQIEAPYAALAVNTSQSRKLWPEQHWLQVGSYLSGRGLKCVLFWGSEEERLRVQRLSAGIPGSLVAPRLALADLAVVLRGAAIVVGVDTGLSHLGAALGRPTIGIFVQTSLEKVPIVGDGLYVNAGGPGQMPLPDEIIRYCEEFLR